MDNLKKYVNSEFGVDPDIFLNAMIMSPGSTGAIAGAISEILLKKHLEEKDFEVVRIKEKPAGSYNSKEEDARGDFYIRKNGTNDWYVVESKGLKTNAEFRGGRLTSKKQVYNYLESIAFPKENYKQRIYNSGYNAYLRRKEKFLKKNPDKTFPSFKWDPDNPGPNNSSLDNIWTDKKELKAFVYSQDDALFTEESYRNRTSLIKELQTHKPSRRTSPSGITQAAPLVGEFSILAVDLFFRTDKHEFVFMNPEKISHSPGSPEHLYQNYTIDTLVKDLSEEPIITHPWYRDIDLLISETSPNKRIFRESQVDNR